MNVFGGSEFGGLKSGTVVSLVVLMSGMVVMLIYGSLENASSQDF